MGVLIKFVKEFLVRFEENIRSKEREEDIYLNTSFRIILGEHCEIPFNKM